MPYFGYENLSTTYLLAFDEIGQHLINAGWELFYTTSATNKTYRSNGENNVGPYVYLNLYTSGTTIYVLFWLHWTTVGVGPLSSQYIVYSSSTSYRFYGSKDFLFVGGNTFVTGSDNGCIYMRTTAPDRMVKTISAPIVGGSSVVLQLPDLNDIFLGYKYNILGILGEGQQELTVTNINTSTNQITVTGCTSNYAAGALFGEHILCVHCYLGTAGGIGNALYYNRNVNTLPSQQIYIKGRLGSQGNSYAHNTDTQLEPMCICDLNRSLGTLPMEHVQKVDNATQVANNLIYINTSGLPVEVSIPTSTTALSLTDTSKNWAVNSLAGKICMIIPETGVCYSRFIVSNTSDTLTFRIPLPTIGLTTQYDVVDSVWRVMAMNTSANMMVINEIF